MTVGLRADSRVMMLASGMTVSQETLLLAEIADRVGLFMYGFSDGAKKGSKPPALIVDKLLGGKKTEGIEKFKTAEEFERALAKIRGK